jgi:hypothetical protein
VAASKHKLALAIDELFEEEKKQTYYALPT